MTTTLTAEQLVEQAQAFSPGAWAHLFDQYHPKMYDYCYLRTGDRAAAEDLASDVFLEALRGIRRYRYRGVPLSAWLYRIARNLTADFVRRRASRPTVPLAASAGDAALASPDDTEAAGRAQDIQAALRQLTDDQQQVIILRFFQDLSHDETAAVLGRSSGAVRVLQSRALSALRRVMTGHPRGQLP
jgi:RNA polymerase sigma-70 factor (ECF subfamily)